MELKTNCTDCGLCKHKAGIQQNNTVSFKINLAAGQVRRQTHLGREFAIVPVVMIKSGVVMNASLVPTEELNPVTWNGVPVTVGHPMVNGNAISANSPSVIEEWSIGTIYNSRVEGGDLKAEAWLDIERVNAVRPGLIDDLELGTNMDVSTGYFSDDIAEAGTINGKDYEVISRNLNPDHLALLPDVEGACSWTDGCGVRANERRHSDMSEPEKKEDEKLSVNAFTKLLGAMGIGHVPKTNERGDDDDFRQMVADLISNDNSPFLPDDEYALREMSYDTLKRMRDDYVGGGDEVATNKKNGGDGATVKTNQEEGDPAVVDKSKEAPKTNAEEGGLPQTQEELNNFIANAVKEAVAPAIAEALKTNASAALTPEQTAALDRAMKINEEHRASLISKITTNSAMTEEDIKEWPVAQLELVANGLRVAPPNYGGRSTPVINASDDDPAIKAMTQQHGVKAEAADEKKVH